MRTTAVAQKAMEELNQAMMETEIKKETKDAIIENTIKNVTNLEVQIALGIAKTKETNKNTGTQAVAMGLQARAIEAQVSNTEADTALKIAQAAKEAGEANKNGDQ